MPYSALTIRTHIYDRTAWTSPSLVDEDWPRVFFINSFYFPPTPICKFPRQFAISPLPFGLPTATARVQYVAFRPRRYVPGRSEPDVFDQRRGGDEHGAAQLFDVHDRDRSYRARGDARLQPRNHSHATDLLEQPFAADVDHPGGTRLRADR